jgi:hypothetical protein
MTLLALAIVSLFAIVARMPAAHLAAQEATPSAPADLPPVLLAWADA